MRSKPRAPVALDFRSVLLAVLLACSPEITNDPDPNFGYLRIRSSSDTVLFVGAGDIAGCNSSYKDEATAALVAQYPTALVFALGDNVYTNDPSGSFACYHASWGGFKSRTYPVVGNHEYLIPGAASYFDYFNGTGVDSGRAGKRSRGYYAFDYGAWRIFALNSEKLITEQAAWIRADHAAHPHRCQLAMFHRPYFTSALAPGRSQGGLQPILDALVAIHAELMLSGHNHHYERFRPQSSDGIAVSNGVRQFVVGTGGGPFTALRDYPRPNSEKIIGNTYGILWLKLYPLKYDFRFLRIGGGARLDSGWRMCQ